MTTGVCSQNGVVTQPNRPIKHFRDTYHQQRRSTRTLLNNFAYEEYDRKFDDRNVFKAVDVSFDKSRTTKPVKSKRDESKRTDLFKECNGADDRLRLPAITRVMESPRRVAPTILELRTRKPKDVYLGRLNAENTQLRLVQEDGYVYHCQRGKIPQSFPPISTKEKYTKKTQSPLAPQREGFICSVDVFRKKLSAHHQDRSSFTLPRAHTDYQLRAISHKAKPNRRMVHYEGKKLRKVDFNTHAMTPVSEFHDGRKNSFVYPDRVVKTFTAVDGVIQNQISPRSILKKQDTEDLPLKKFKRRGKRKSSINFGENMIREIMPSSSRRSFDNSVSFDCLADDKATLGFPSLARSRISLPKGRARQGSEFQASQDFIRVMSQLESETGT